MSRLRARHGHCTGQELRSLRDKLGISAKACAGLLALSAPTMWRWEATPAAQLPLGDYQARVVERLRALARCKGAERLYRLEELHLALNADDPLEPLRVLLTLTKPKETTASPSCLGPTCPTGTLK